MTEIINFPTTEISADQTAVGSVQATPIQGAQLDGPKTVHFRGRDVTLKYTLLSMQRLEAVGVGFAELEKMGEGKEVSFSVIGKLLWAGLCVEFNDATLEEVLNSFEISDMASISEAISEAMNRTGK